MSAHNGGVRIRSGEQPRNAVERSMRSLESYVAREGLASYDPHDLMSTRVGKMARRGFYGSNRRLFAPVVGALYGIDLVAPGIRRLFCSRSISAEAVCYVARGQLELWRTNKDERHLCQTVRLLHWLSDNSIEGYSGACWGLPFDWQTTHGLVPSNTPCVTVTATVALLMLDAAGCAATGEFAAVGRSSALFVLRDLDTAGSAVSYTPIDHRFVVNANAYAADLLLEVGQAGDDEAMLSAGRGILAEVLKAQREDGSWPYFLPLGDTDCDVDFVDCLHTCMVLECLMRIQSRVHACRAEAAIHRGVRLLVEGFVGEDGSCRHYLSFHSPHLVRSDARSCAEAIRCLCLADDFVPGSKDVAARIALWTIRHMQLPNGSFRHRLATVPTLAASYNRWSNGPMLAALALLDGVLTEDESSPDTPAGCPDVLGVCDVAH